MTTKITKGLLATASVGTDQIEDGAVDTAGLADGAVKSAKIGPQQVEQHHIAEGAIGWKELADSAITSLKYSINSLPLLAIPDGLITAAKMANGAITTNKLGTNAVTTSKLGLQAVDTVNYKASSINSTALGNNAVVTEKIDNNAVTYAKLQQSPEGSLITFNSSSTSYALPAGAEGSVLSIQSGRPSWSGSNIPVGAIMDYFGNSAPTGWLILDGRTIGSPSSGAAYASTLAQNLYYHLWNNFTNTIIPVSSGRGTSAGADWSANKTITLPDFTGRVSVMADLDTVSPSGTISTKTFTNISQVGQMGGIEEVTLVADNIPDHRHHMFRAATSTNPEWNTHAAAVPTSTVNQQVTRWDGNLSNEFNHQHSYRMFYNGTYVAPSAGMTSSPIDTTGASISTGTAVNNMQPSILVVKIIKL